MKPFSDRMYVDDVVFCRAQNVTGTQGGARRTFDAGTAMKASVQNTGGKDAALAVRDGRSHTTVSFMVRTPTDVSASTGDKFEWDGRTLVVEAPTVPKGIGNVTWLTHCLEMK